MTVYIRNEDCLCRSVDSGETFYDLTSPYGKNIDFEIKTTTTGYVTTSKGTYYTVCLLDDRICWTPLKLFGNPYKFYTVLLMLMIIIVMVVS